VISIILLCENLICCFFVSRKERKGDKEAKAER